MKPRVLVLIKTLGRGGAERLLLDSLEHADHSRFEYQVAYLVRDAPYLVEIRDRGIAVTCLAGRTPVAWPVRLRRLIRSARIDLVHVHSPVMAVAARLVTRVPVVYTEHSAWGSHRWLTRWANRATFGRNAHVFAVADEVRASIRRSEPVIETLHYGIDPRAVQRWLRDRVDVRTEFGIPAAVPVIATVANLRPQKGHRVLLEAAQLVRVAVPDARFVFIGDGRFGSA